MISVIIPTFNRSLFLLPAMESVLAQSFTAMELIVVDDGSTDDTPELVAAMQRKSGTTPVIYIQQRNRGAAAARNTGIRAAAGDVLCFLDSDDTFVRDKLARQFARLEQSPRLISHTRETWYRRGTLLNQKKKHHPPDGDIFQASLRMCVVGMSTVMIRRPLFEHYGLFDDTLPCCEDYDFWLRVSTKERFLLVDEPLTVKNGGRADQLSVRYRMGMDRFRIRSLVKLLEERNLDRHQYSLARKELERKCRIYGNGCLKHGREDEGLACLRIPQRFTTA